MRAALGAALLLASAALADDSATKFNVAILDFRGSNVSANDAAAVTDFVRSAMIRAGGYVVVDKANMDKILSEQAFQQTGCTSSECAVKLGKLLNVQKMVVGEYSVLEGVRYMTASLVDVESGRMERTAQVKDFDAHTIDVAADRIVSQLTQVRVQAQEGAEIGAAGPAEPMEVRHRLVVGIGAGLANLKLAVDFTNVSVNLPGAAGPYAGATADATAHLVGPGGEVAYWLPLGGRIAAAVCAEGYQLPNHTDLPDAKGGGITFQGGDPADANLYNHHLTILGGGADVAFNVRPRLDLLAGARFEAWSGDLEWGMATNAAGQSTHGGNAGTPPTWHTTAVTGELGAEWFFSRRLSLEALLRLPSLVGTKVFSPNGLPEVNYLLTIGAGIPQISASFRYSFL